MQRYQQLIVMVADVAGLPPYGLPRLIEGTRLLTSERKTALEVGLAGAGCACSPLSGIFLIGVGLQFQSKFRGDNHCLPFIRKVINWFTQSGQREVHLHLSVG